MVSFHKVPIREVWDDIMYLAGEHWKETEQYQTVDLKPDRVRYFEYNDMGYHHQYIAKDGGKVVGHAGMYVNSSMHTRARIATEDTWFLLKDYRKGRNAIKFYQFIEDDLKSLGVEEITMHAKLANNSSRIMEYLGYEFFSKGYIKNVRPKPTATS